MQTRVDMLIRIMSTHTHTTGNTSCEMYKNDIATHDISLRTLQKKLSWHIQQSKKQKN